MSLDVHLEMPSAETPPAGKGRIYIREDGCTREITRAEWDELRPDIEPAVVTLPADAGEVYSRNITHNLTKMAREAALYQAMWCPLENGWRHARDLIEPLRDGLATLQSDPERFKQFNPANGWGDYEGLLEFAADYLGACMKWPDAEVRVSK